MNRISFADFQFPLAVGLFNERGEEKVVMVKATASTSSATIVARKEKTKERTNSAVLNIFVESKLNTKPELCT
ncbi:MAG: hypothetical protein WCK78_19490 [Paludibacter sp.]